MNIMQLSFHLCLVGYQKVSYGTSTLKKSFFSHNILHYKIQFKCQKYIYIQISSPFLSDEHIYPQSILWNISLLLMESTAGLILIDDKHRSLHTNVVSCASIAADEDMMKAIDWAEVRNLD